VDFVCGGKEYVCVDDFDCTAGHAFLCTNDHACEVQFTCAGGTVKGCPPNDPKEAVCCTPGHNVGDKGYNQHSVGDSNNNPGDFLCAHPPGANTTDGIDSFNCHSNFDCKAISDFSCHKSGEFACAQQGGGDNNFQCQGPDTVSPFACFSTFYCTSSDLFECGKDGATYNCASSVGSYAECVSKTEKECKSDYVCKKDHDCNAPGFVCPETGSPKVYDCVKSGYKGKYNCPNKIVIRSSKATNDNLGKPGNLCRLNGKNRLCSLFPPMFRIVIECSPCCKKYGSWSQIRYLHRQFWDESV